MATIISDDPAIKNILEELVILITDNGAMLHSEIEIVSLKGQLSIFSNLDRLNSETIIMIPETCLPAVSDFKISLDGDEFIAEPDENKPISKLHVRVFSLIMKLFNLTGKISAHVKESPRLIFRKCPSILAHFDKGSLRRFDNEHYLDAVVIESFFATRHCTFADKKVLMPIIDCLNHHNSASPYIVDVRLCDDQGGGISISNSKPDLSSNEVFVCYNNYLDTLDVYVNYGFLDVSPSVSRSISLLLDMGDIGKIQVDRVVVIKAPLDQHVNLNDLGYPKDLHYYFPTIQRLGDDMLVVNSLIIPSESAPMSLRRILKILISILAPDISADDLLKAVYHAELGILTVNHAYYDGLLTLLDTEFGASVLSDAKETLLQVILVQKKHLVEYKNRLSL